MYRITNRRAEVGDIVLCNGYYARVNEIVLHEPGEHRPSPIKNELSAREYVTSEGSRWDSPDSIYFVSAYEEVKR